MDIMRLTDAKIRALQPREVRFLVADGRGLYIEVLPSGKLSWIYRYRILGKPEKIAFGRYPEMSLKIASQKRDEQAALVVSGKSPAQEKKLARSGQNEQITVREFGERWFREVVTQDRKDPAAPRRYLDNEIYPRIGNLPLKQVTADIVQTIVFNKRDHGSPAAAAAIRNQIKRIFDYAIVCGVATINPALATPTRFITSKKSRKRALRPNEIRIYLQTLYKSGARRQFKLALHLLLISLVRKSELLLAKWEHVDFEQSEWLIPAENSKNGLGHLVYLSREAIALFTELKKLAGTSEWVMPGRGNINRPFSSSALNTALTGINFELEPFTIHDLRRTASTLLHEKDFRSDVIEKALNHSIGGVRGVYNRAEYGEQRRSMLQFWGSFVAGLASEQQVIVSQFGTV
jgi:integrase